MEHPEVLIVFDWHVDIPRRALYFPDGQATWRTNTTAIYLIVWDCAGWSRKVWSATAMEMTGIRC